MNLAEMLKGRLRAEPEIAGERSVMKAPGRQGLALFGGDAFAAPVRLNCVSQLPRSGTPTGFPNSQQESVPGRHKGPVTVP